MISNRHMRRRKLFPHRKRSFVGAAALFLTFYTALILGSSCVHADLNPTNSPLFSSSVSTDLADDHSHESLCGSVHEHALRAVAVSDHSEIVSVLLAFLFSAHNVPAPNYSGCDAFRPPGSGFPYLHSNQLSTVLRI